MPAKAISFRLVFVEDNVQYLCPTCSEGPMKLFSFPRISLPIVLFIVFCLAFLGTNRAFAQQATAQLMGTVKDPTAAVVAGAKVSLRNTGTNITHSTTTNKGGDYLFALVPIGAYELTVEQQGFEKY